MLNGKVALSDGRKQGDRQGDRPDPCEQRAPAVIVNYNGSRERAEEVKESD